MPALLVLGQAQRVACLEKDALPCSVQKRRIQDFGPNLNIQCVFLAPLRVKVVSSLSGQTSTNPNHLMCHFIVFALAMVHVHVLILLRPQCLAQRLNSVLLAGAQKL